ncbi:MAG TPA: hypothetical protein PKJ83_06090 [Cyclobacteriaceae bacterium]|nr:hypothetical protein [Cyclobacteriaceae bacterium]
MNKAVRCMVMMGAMVFIAASAIAQGKVDEDRMQRDLEVTENILSTLIKQKFEKRSFFPIEIQGEYREGHGVTYRLPYEFNGPMVWGVGSDLIGDGRSFSYTFEFPNGEQAELARVLDEDQRVKTETIRSTGRSKTPPRKVNIDSIRDVTADKIIEACKEFIADYGDLITQLAPNERIMITNRGDGERLWYGAFVNVSKPSYISIETTKAEVTQLKQGKVSRDQFMKNLKVINSVMDDELQPDLELLTSIFNRLYQRDLSKTYFTEENVYYERLKDYGVIYYMEVYSSNQSDFDRKYIMPTIGVEGLSQEERDKKVKELYPQFEKDIKADILEYGRTVKSLKPEEFLVFNIKLTKCQQCGIPSSLELSVQAEVLNNYGSGKLTKEAALNKISIKKGSNQ